jgi:hypothetical protein
MDHTNEDDNRVHFPILSSELTAALGAIEDMADGTDAVPDSVVRGRPPAIFRAGGPMLVLRSLLLLILLSSVNHKLTIGYPAQAEAV